MTARLTLALAVTGSLLGRAAIAHACGGGGGDSGSSGGDSSSSSSSDSSSSSSSDSTPAEPACVETSDIHGYRTCTDYGTWGVAANLPAISFELSTWTAQVDLSGVDVSGNIHHDYGPDYTYRVVGEDLGNQAMAVGGKARILGHRRLGFGTAVYGGVEGGVAGIVSDDVEAMESADGTAMLAPRATAMFVVGGVVGVEQGFGRLSIGGELMGGVRGIKVNAESHRGACETIESDLHATGLLEARVRADLWVTPWMTVGAYAGRDLFGAQTSAGLGIGGHLRAFDGTR